jgi:phage tail sheath gpL-like
MRLVIGFVFVALAVTPAAAFEGCAGYSKVVASTEAATPATPVQTAEVPSTTQTK